MLKGFQASGFQPTAFQVYELVIDQITKASTVSYSVITKAKTLSVTELITKAGS